ncbi:hypothetical protein J5I95_13750 [Candidatus Poribacteria bacterium]|nr:hypothetical protein [Candidatus Poribacteria bacterium]
MHNFFMVFGFGMMCFFGVIALASVVMFVGDAISGTQFLILIPACLAGAGLSAELFDYGYKVER